MKSSKWICLVLTPVLILSLREGLRAGNGSPAGAALADISHQAIFPIIEAQVHSWSNGYLLTFVSPPVMVPNKAGVVLYDRYGAVAREPIIWLNGAKSISLTDVAVSRSGHVVVGGGTTNNEGVIANFIAEIGSDDQVHRVVRTSPFVPWRLCAMEDGTVWAFGNDRDASLSLVENAPRLRQYSFEKGQLQAILDTSALPDALSSRDLWRLSQGRYLGELNLRCNSTTAVLYNAGTGDLVEYDLQRNKLTVSKVAALPAERTFRITGFALTDRGEMYASFHDASNPKAIVSGLFHLEPDSTSSRYKWVAVPGTVGIYLQDSPIQKLWGADGNKLVFSRLKDGRLYWTK
jgi:hypothetical protein